MPIHTKRAPLADLLRWLEVNRTRVDNVRLDRYPHMKNQWVCTYRIVEVRPHGQALYLLG